MPTPKDLAGYPEWFFTIAERAQREGYSEEIPLTSKGAAINLRQRFYAFRQLMSSAGHPHAKGMIELTLSVRGSTLCFSKFAGLTAEAMAQLGMNVSPKGSVEVGAANAPDRIEVSDAAEAQLEQMLRGNARVEAAEETIAGLRCPPHEWDGLQTRCLLCGAPYVEA